MSERRQHLLLTRFAIKIRRVDGVRSPYQTPPMDWVLRRLDLFRLYCAPSVRAQTFSEFRWLVFIYDGFDPEIAAQIQACDPRIEMVTAPVSPLPAVDTDLVVSTRLDSDDGLASTALETVDHYAARAASVPRVLLLKHGYWFQHTQRIGYVHRGWSFQAMVERATQARGILVESCDTVNQHYPTTIHTDPAWLRVVHGENLRNRWNPRGPVVSAHEIASMPDFAFLGHAA